MNESNPVAAPQRSKFPWGLAITIVIALMFLCVAGVLGYLYFQERTLAQAQSTQIAQATATLRTQAQAIERANATMQAQVITMQSQARQMDQARSTVEAQSERLAAVPPGFEGILLLGPQNGSLVHDADTLIEADCGNVSLKNFTASAEFTNPVGADENPFSYGFTFRKFQYRISISVSNYGTSVILGESTSDNAIEVRDASQVLQVGRGEKNQLRVVVKDQAIFVYVNDEFFGTMYVKSLPDTSGDVCIATGLFRGDEMLGESTDYRNFTLWSLP